MDRRVSLGTDDAVDSDREADLAEPTLDPLDGVGSNVDLLPLIGTSGTLYPRGAATNSIIDLQAVRTATSKSTWSFGH